MANPLRPADPIVLDASVAVKWYLKDEDHVADALNLFERYADGLLVFYAPTQIRFEVPSAITVATQRQLPRLSAAIGGQAIEKFLALEIILAHDDRLILDAYPLAHRYGCALYDALYLALAQRLGIPLVTADDKLYQRTKQLREVIGLPTIGSTPPGAAPSHESA